MNLRRSMRLLGAAGAFCSIGSTFGGIYYVSPTGSDTNSGTSPSSPWQSLAKVSATSFPPGSQILFLAGGNWYGQQLLATSSGTPSQPITYGSYGNGPNPTFWGSLPIQSSGLEWYMGTTYFIPYTTPVNAFLINHQFTDNSVLLTGTNDDATNLTYVQSHVNSAYYQSVGNPGIVVNLGVTHDNVYNNYYQFTGTVQQDVIDTQVPTGAGSNNLVFQNLDVRETAQSNAGYAIRVENSNNVTVMNCNVSGGGKHAVGVIDTNNFLGQNINASSLMPDQGYGGATAFVSYCDSNVSNVTNQWINDSFTNPNGRYQGFIAHDSPGGSVANPIASILVKNLNSQSSPAITVYSEYHGEQVSIIGGTASGTVQLVGGNTLVDGLTLTGDQGEITVNGNSNIVQNTIINGDIPNWTAGRNGAIDVVGPGNIIRFNTVNLGPGAAIRQSAVSIETPNSNTQIYGNVFNTQFAPYLQAFGGLPGVDAHDNLLAGTSTPMVVYPFATWGPLSDWPTSMNANQLIGDANFADPSNGNLSLTGPNVASYVFNPTSGQYVMYDYYGNVRPTIGATMGAIQAPSNGLTGTSWNVDSDGNWSNAGNWTNGVVPNTTDVIAILSTVITSPRTVTVDGPETVGILYFTSAASFTVAGSATLSFNSSNGASAIDVSAGNHTISAPINLTDNTTVNIGANSTLTLAGSVSGAGSLIAAGGGALLIAPGASVVAPVVVNGSLTFSPNTSGGIFVDHVPSLSIGERGVVTLADPGAGNRGRRMLMVLGSLSFASTTSGTLDVTQNDLDLQNTTASAVTADVLEGLSGNGFSVTGGILSSVAAADTTHLTALGVVHNTGSNGKALFGTGAPLGLFDGYSPALGDVLVKFTYYGDANLNGKVDSTDYTRVDAGFLQQLTGWYNGDFNYDGAVNGSDYTLIDNAFNTQGASLASLVDPTVQIADQIAPVTAVPEPMGAGLLSIAAVGLLGRRKHVAV